MCHFSFQYMKFAHHLKKRELPALRDLHQHITSEVRGHTATTQWSNFNNQCVTHLYIKLFWTEENQNNFVWYDVLCNICCIVVCYGMYCEAVYKWQTDRTAACPGFPLFLLLIQQHFQQLFQSFIPNFHGCAAVVKAAHLHFHLLTPKETPEVTCEIHKQQSSQNPIWVYGAPTVLQTASTNSAQWMIIFSWAITAGLWKPCLSAKEPSQTITSFHHRTHTH